MNKVEVRRFSVLCLYLAEAMQIEEVRLLTEFTGAY